VELLIFIVSVVISAWVMFYSRVEEAEKRERATAAILARENQYMVWLRTHDHSPQCDCELNRRAIR